MLALVHISSRHFVPDILAEAREAFPGAVAPRDFDLVEIPLPERGGPVLVENGSRVRCRCYKHLHAGPLVHPDAGFDAPASSRPRTVGGPRPRSRPRSSYKGKTTQGNDFNLTHRGRRRAGPRLLCLGHELQGRRQPHQRRDVSSASARRDVNGFKSAGKYDSAESSASSRASSRSRSTASRASETRFTGTFKVKAKVFRKRRRRAAHEVQHRRGPLDGGSDRPDAHARPARRQPRTR